MKESLIILFLYCCSCTNNNAIKLNDEKVKIHKSSILLEDSYGNIWNCNFDNKGVEVFNTQTKTFKQYTEKDGLSNNYVYAIMEDEQKKIWIGTADGVSIFSNNKITTIPIGTITGNGLSTKTKIDGYGVPYPIENGIWCFLQDSKNRYWLGTMDGVYIYENNNFLKFTVNDGTKNNTGEVMHWIESIIEDAQGRIWFGGRGTNGLFCLIDKELKHYRFEHNNWMRPLLQTKDGKIYFSTRSKPFVWYYDNNTWATFGECEIDNWVFSMIEDNKGTLWLNYGKEHDITCFANNQFTSLYVPLNNLEEVYKTLMKGNDDLIWISNKNDLCSYDGKNFNVYNYNKN